MTLCSAARFPTSNLCAGVRMVYGGRPHGLSVNSDTLALASSITLEGIFLLSGPFGSDIFDDDAEGLQYLRITAIFSATHTSPKSHAIFFHDFWLSVKFWRVKLWQIKAQFAKFAKVLHHQRFPLYGKATYVISYHGILCHNMLYVMTIVTSLLFTNSYPTISVYS